MKKFGAYFSYFFFWIVFFVITRGLFLLYHLPQTEGLSFETIVKVFVYGLRMDASFAAYLSVIPFLLYLIKSVDPLISVRGTVRAYTRILIVILCFIAVADLELFTDWGFRLDATPLKYFKTPKEMFTSMSSSPWIMLLIIFAFLCFLFLYLFRYFLKSPFKGETKFNVFRLLMALFLLGVLFVPIRGGIQKIALNVSNVYFSDQIYADQAAINLPWNVVSGFINRNSSKNPFNYYDEKKSESLVHELYSTGAPKITPALSTDRPNIIFIILESYTAKWISALGGEQGVTPELDSIAAHGLLFTNIYAAGDRSEKGQVAVLSGYPNQAIRSIVRIPEKTRKLPSLAKTLESYGYTCSYLYGGEMAFANIKSFLLNVGYKDLVSKYDFPLSERTTSWGVHDQYTFSRFLSDIQKEKQPFFSTIFSLSSHEPFDVPLHHFDGKTGTDLFRNSVYYTDSVLGDFIKKLKLTPLWKNSLVVITADHGHRLPGDDPTDAPSKFHIPLIFTGGALTLKGKIDKIGSQTDIVSTVLDQMHISTEDFKWGKDLLDSTSKSFAFYNFNDGFGWMTPEGYATFDNISRQIIRESTGFDTTQLKYPKAYMQYSYQDYLNR